MTQLTPDRLDIQAALYSRLQHHPRLGDRASYIGASEVGTCLRRAIASKRTPPELDPASAGRLASGRALENEVIQLIRLALGPQLRDTGRVQKEYRHATLPFVAHPDGRILSDHGDGILEVKTASASAFKRYTQEGLPQHYLDQVQAQMGLSGLSWALLVLVSRENLAEAASFEIRFNPDHYRYLEKRARLAATYLNTGDTLPGGEPENGFCFNCPFRDGCPEHLSLRQAGERGEIPEVTRLQLEAQVDELVKVEAELSPLEARVSELRGQVKDTLQNFNVAKVILESGVIQTVVSSRTSFDSKALLRTSPEIYNRFLKLSNFSTLRITPYRNRSQSCL